MDQKKTMVVHEEPFMTVMYMISKVENFKGNLLKLNILLIVSLGKQWNL